MESSAHSRREDGKRDHRPKSPSYVLEEEQRRRMRRRDKEMRDGEESRGERDGDDRHRAGGERRRRSRSPISSSHKRRADRDSPRRGHRERSPNRRDGRVRDSQLAKEDDAVPATRKSKGPLPSQAASFQSNNDPGAISRIDEAQKQKPNFALTGLLAAASNSIAQADGTSIVLKYHEPAEARKPPSRDEWKLFVFKGSDILETLELSSRSCWLIGRELAVVDMPAEHPSVSKQHAVIQFRYIEKKNEYGDKLGRVRPYLIDLDSANGTLLNKEEIPPSRYLELQDKDMIQFGQSTREYVLMLSPKG